MDDNDIEKAILKKVYIWLGVTVVGMFTSTALFAPKVILDDRPTFHDLELLKHQLTFHIDKAEMGIRGDMPPICTRKRIVNIENYLEKTSPEFERAEICW